ncbi:MAG: hypothetical protein QOI04_602 [Verrucomicrobiota bacterium]
MAQHSGSNVSPPTGDETTLPFPIDQSGEHIQPAPTPGEIVPNAATVIEWANVGPDWDTAADWVGGVAPTSSTTANIAAFGSTGAAPVNPVLAAARSIAGVSFLTNAYSYTVSGAALTVGLNGISNSAVLSTETFSNAINPSINQEWSNAGSLILNGTVDLNSSAATTRTLTVSGAGATIFNGVIQNSRAGSAGNLTYTGTGNGSLTLANANTYNGTTTLFSGSVTATHDGAFGTSNVSLTGGAVTLRLQGGITNDYIANTATLSMVPGSTITLNFVGTDIVGSFVIGGVVQPAGVYTAINEPGLLFGTGSFTVLPVPEPSTWVSLLSGGALLIAWQRRRFRR